MYIIWIVCGYTVIVLFIVLAHMLMTDYLNSYDKEVAKRTVYWLNIIKRGYATQNYRIKKRELKKLKKTRYLSAFYKIQKVNPREIGMLLEDNATTIIKLMRKNRSASEKAYFSYILAQFSSEYNTMLAKYTELMLEYIVLDSVYLRENSLKVLYKIGNASKIGRAFKTLTNKGITHNQKLLTDGLMMYPNDEKQLICHLIGEIQMYGECYQVAIVNYMVYKNYHEFDDKVIPMLNNSTYVDLKCSIIRLLGKKTCDYYKKILLQQIRLDENESNWETAAVAARMLGEYAGDEEVEEALEKSITARNWYVRSNSAEAISKIYVSKGQVEDVLTGEDKYAAAALAYALRKQGEE